MKISARTRSLNFFELVSTPSLGICEDLRKVELGQGKLIKSTELPYFLHI